jgi:hypothetical protein
MLVEHVLLAFELECGKTVHDFLVSVLDVAMTELYCVHRFSSDATYAHPRSVLIPLIARHVKGLPFTTIMGQTQRSQNLLNRTRSQLVETHAAMHGDTVLRDAALRVLAHPWTKTIFHHYDQRALPFP